MLSKALHPHKYFWPQSDLRENSQWKILDIGCGYRAHPAASTIADVQDFSKLYKDKKFVKIEEKTLPFKDKEFDLVISLGTFHNLRLVELKIALSEMERVGKKRYLMLESYRNEEELFNLQCWALTAESFFDKDEWIWLYKNFGYTGDYEFIYF